MPNSAVVHLIDDDEAVRHSLAFVLTAAGHAVRVYESGSAFLAALQTLQPGCIVSDVRMPGVDGLELLRKLRELGVDMPVIIITGHADVPLAVEAMKAGASDFIEKPFDDETLLRAIRVALESYEASSDRDAERAEIRGRLEFPHAARARGSRRSARGLSQQDHRLRSEAQPPHRRSASRQRHGEDGGDEPLQPRADGAYGKSAADRLNRPSRSSRKQSIPPPLRYIKAVSLSKLPDTWKLETG